MNKIKLKELVKFTIDYYQGKYPYLRYGQAFMNEFEQGETDPELFYCEDNIKANLIILERYIEDD